VNAAHGVQKWQIKRVLGLLLLLLITGALLGAIYLAAELVIFSSSGANRASVFNVVPELPPDQINRVTWLPDAAAVQAGRAVEPVVRRQIAETYLRAWAQLDLSYQMRQPYGLATWFGGPLLVQMNEVVSATLSSPWRIRQSSLSHTLELTFYAADGSTVALRDHAARFVQQYTLAGSDPVITTSASTYSVVMVLEQGNWRIRAWRREAEQPPTAQPSMPATAQPGKLAGFVSAAGRQLQLDGQPFLVRGANYYPAVTPWTLFWPHYDRKQTARDLRAMRQLGLNTARIFVPYDDFGGDVVDPAQVASLQDFLDQAQTNGLKVIVTLFDHRTDHSIENWGADELHLAGIVAPVAGHGAILAWDIKNEADRDAAFNTPARNMAWLRHMAGEVRRLDPHHLITVGWSTPAAAAAAPDDFVDLVSFHYYDAAADYAAGLAALHAVGDNRPLLLSEYGQSTWRWLWPAAYLEAQQAGHIAAIRAANAQGGEQGAIAGELVWALYDFSTVPLAEFRFPWQQATQAHMGVLRTDGSAKPAAALLADHAPGTSSSSISPQKY
jgi:hypothetical protein